LEIDLWKHKALSQMVNPETISYINIIITPDSRYNTHLNNIKNLAMAPNFARAHPTDKEPM